MAYVIVTELEKTIILVLLVLSRGDIKRHIPKKAILAKFTSGQRRMVERLLKKLVGSKYVERRGATESYRLTDSGIVFGKRLMVTGVSLWKVKQRQEIIKPRRDEKPNVPEIAIEASEEKQDD